jgi:hypothetical protein
MRDRAANFRKLKIKFESSLLSRAQLVRSYSYTTRFV